MLLMTCINKVTCTLRAETLDALKAAVADFKKGFRSEGTSHLVDAAYTLLLL